MVHRKDLVKYLDELFDLPRFSRDHSNNGLQLEGAEEIRKIVFGVDGCQTLFDAARGKNAQMVFVHHGISWGAEPRRFTGIHAARLRTLFEGNLNLYAVHLPLDAHPEYGNNAVLFRLAGLVEPEPFCEYDGCDIGFVGNCTAVETIPSLKAKLEGALHCRAAVGGRGGEIIRRVGVVSGGGGNDALFSAAEAGADALITGELTHEMLHYAEELKLPVIALGHYASETTGVNAVKQHLQSRFDVECEFLDFPTGL